MTRPIIAAGAVLLMLALLRPPTAQGQAAAFAARSPEQMFAQTCARCHGPGGWGTRELAKRSAPGEAELLQRKTIPADLVRFVVRHGVGSMPPFTPTDLTDDEVNRLALWLERRR